MITIADEMARFDRSESYIRVEVAYCAPHPLRGLRPGSNDKLEFAQWRPSQVPEEVSSYRKKRGILGTIVVRREGTGDVLYTSKQAWTLQALGLELHHHAEQYRSAAWYVGRLATLRQERLTASGPRAAKLDEVITKFEADHAKTVADVAKREWAIGRLRARVAKLPTVGYWRATTTGGDRFWVETATGTEASDLASLTWNTVQDGIGERADANAAARTLAGPGAECVCDYVSGLQTWRAAPGRK